jgi:hypothetical protein
MSKVRNLPLHVLQIVVRICVYMEQQVFSENNKVQLLITYIIQYWGIISKYSSSICIR